MADNAWLRVPLADYEGHMAHVGQAALLGRLFAEALDELRPRSLAVLGAAGGNGFERLVGTPANRVVALDINPGYLDALERRHAGRVPGLEVVCGDLCDPAVDFAPVDYVHAALVLEYLDPALALDRIARWLLPGGALGIVLQLPGAASVSPSPFSSLAVLGGHMRLQEESDVRHLARAAGFTEIAHRVLEMPGGKRFAWLRFRIGGPRQKD